MGLEYLKIQDLPRNGGGYMLWSAKNLERNAGCTSYWILGEINFSRCCGKVLTRLSYSSSRKQVIWINTDEAAFNFLRKDLSISKQAEASAVLSSSVENPLEVSLLVDCVLSSLLESGLKPSQVGIVTAYQSQLALIQEALQRVFGEQPEGERIESSTVDQFQGKDKDCLLVSLVRCNDYGGLGDLLRDWKRLNVLLTRSKKKLVLVGSKDTFKKSESRLWLELLTLIG